MFESTKLSRENLSREIGRASGPACAREAVEPSDHNHNNNHNTNSSDNTKT